MRDYPTGRRARMPALETHEEKLAEAAKRVAEENAMFPQRTEAEKQLALAVALKRAYRLRGSR